MRKPIGKNHARLLFKEITMQDREIIDKAIAALIAFVESKGHTLIF